MLHPSLTPSFSLSLFLCTVCIPLSTFLFFPFSLSLSHLLSLYPLAKILRSAESAQVSWHGGKNWLKNCLKTAVNAFYGENIATLYYMKLQKNPLDVSNALQLITKYIKRMH